MKGLMGRKVGMTQIFNEDGIVTPVTVIEVAENVVTQIKSDETDGYNSVQVGYGEKKIKNTIKPLQGHFEKAGTTPKRTMKEFRVDSTEGFTAGQELKADLFQAGDKVDVTGISKGKGFQGVIKRHGQSRGPMAHGSRYHRRPGSMGASAYPGRVFKGKNLPGHMGNVQVTAQNLEIVRVDLEKNLLLIKGAVPGPKKGVLVIQTTVKQGK
ncbi:ribosomal protein L3 [Alkaliphilus metalliredigens QYMF]|uniref:Large ribosomal subunit protein uL3 n=1 Tax=Alkaliphilus metalliredigens (strain QYMF) TaxID=293826 RepID=RL3_ALKMQ|nr:50S ribosomal protein L3 [Alkaliphilus metalliredigens]A6TWI2.1 RecName: Full=Large ribosomal subunit protein uL3; AltName: Full=50S ribosomal protein L3 [Alkaliphilus metalliredigens QYMF]ABR50550.1 ribosomal protein L3 [Alkaliphilus metalliredigens QYMF]